MSWAEDNGHDMPEPDDAMDESYPEDVAFEKLVAETGQAWLIRFDNHKEFWFPKSRCNVETDERPGGMLTAPVWLLDKNGIHY